ncbi:MAG: hypothetical protein H6812_02930 [Phycisphaeraceae bacterium]|nr:hypothetical protein [Phycisphaerales bacterium]MCB9842194.1 hypothetical protein [Phycisphaeraceae bacterium]
MRVSAETTQVRKLIDALHADLSAQGHRVAGLIERSVEALWERDAEKARGVIEEDEAVDREDVRIEKEAVRLLAHAMQSGASRGLGEGDVRRVMTLVKVNNEFERIADMGVAIAEKQEVVASLDGPPPAKFRMMANSVIGIMQTTSRAFETNDLASAQVVLASDAATERFEQAVLREVEELLASGGMSVDYALALHTIAGAIKRMADHCTNVAEQVIYVASGKIVRHQVDHWTAPQEPGV